MRYTIADLEHLSGVSVHNIRIWERRYGALQPSRTAGNTRFYDDDQLRRLLNIASLVHTGHKISRACAMGREELSKYLQQEISLTLAAEERDEYFISQIISHSLAYDEEKISTLISSSIQQAGVLETYKRVIYPTLVRLGLMWLNESLCPSQEHFVAAIIRRKLFTAIDGCKISPDPAAPKWLLFLPEDEDHDIGLLLASYLLRVAGQQVVYLGAKVPLDALAATATATRPDHLLLFMTRARPLKEAQAYIDQLAARQPSVQVYLSGNPQILSAMRYPARFQWLKQLLDFETLLNKS